MEPISISIAVQKIKEFFEICKMQPEASYHNELYIKGMGGFEIKINPIGPEIRIDENGTRWQRIE